MLEKSSDIILEFESRKNEIEDILIKELINYVMNGTLPEKNNIARDTCYNIIQNFTNKGIGDHLLKYHNEKIKEITNECYEKIKDLNELIFIDSFILYTERLNYLFYEMSQLFLYLSINYLQKIDDKINARKYEQDDVSEFSMNLYKEYFFDKLQDKLFNILNEILIKEERNGNMEYKQKTQEIMIIINYMDITKPKIIKINDNYFGWKENNPSSYKEKWYNNYKDATIKYVKEKAEKDKKLFSEVEYINNELKFIKEEKERQNSYISPIYHKELNNIFNKYLIKNYIKTKEEIEKMFKEKKLFEIKDYFQLLKSNKEELNIFKNQFKEYIKNSFSSLICNKSLYNLDNDSKKIVPELINLKKEINEIILFGFDNDIDFIDIKDEEIIDLKGKFENPVYFSDYVHLCMKYEFRNKSQEEIEEIINEIIFILKNIKYHNRIITKLIINFGGRLLWNLSISMDFEKLFITKLEQEMGINFTREMRYMINDIEISKKDFENYKISSINNGNPSGIDFKVNIISNISLWKIHKSFICEIEIPKFLQFYLDDFQNYYNNKYNNNSRKLIWILGLSKLDIQYLYLKDNIISRSSLTQLLILLCLEKYNKLNLKEIAEILKCDIRLIINDVQGLIYNPSFNPNAELDQGIILANIDSDKREFKETTEISINKDFNPSKNKFDTQPIIVTENYWTIKQKEIMKSEEEKLIIERNNNNLIQSVLTRILKQRIGQITEHLWIINEVMKQIDEFKVKPNQIKLNIERLIEKSIIRRNGSLYEYIP